MATFSEKFFCPAPWSHIYYQMNSPSPCHVIRNQFEATPQEYINSDWLKKLKTDMMSGTVPDPCMVCKNIEKQGLKSTRGAWWHYYYTGPEPHYEDQWFANKFDENTPTDPYRMEFRFSNLCNMKCKMCDETSSSEWAKEKIEHNLPFVTEISVIDRENKKSIVTINPKSVDELKDLTLASKNMRLVCLTGGEPFIIKEYYEYLDHLIDNGISHRIDLELFTNCSVYNPLFVERLKKFKSVEFVMSIDGVGKTAEYIRTGTPWSTIEKNVIQFNKLGAPFNIFFNTAISAYTLLDVSSLATFLMRLYEDNNSIQTKCYHVRFAEHLNYNRLTGELRAKAIEEIDKAVEILTAPNFVIFATELKGIKRNLLDRVPGDPALFTDFTEKMDGIRNDSFQETFGLALQKGVDNKS